jgi:hypothetical protein
MVDEVKLNRKLNLIATIESERGTLHIIAAPIARTVFEDNFMIMCRAYSAVYSNGLGVLTGPRAAALLIKREAKEIGEEIKGNMLIEEIHRLTNVLAPTMNGGGYELMDYNIAVKQGIIDEDAAADIDAAICFFTLALRAGPQRQVQTLLEALGIFWNAETTSLTLTEYMRSLQTSMTTEIIGQKAETVVTPTLANAIPVTVIPQ